jgi:hypothetical protein
MDMTSANSMILLQQNEDLFSDFSQASLVAGSITSKHADSHKLSQKLKDNESRLMRSNETNQSLINKVFALYHTFKVGLSNG